MIGKSAKAWVCTSCREKLSSRPRARCETNGRRSHSTTTSPFPSRSEIQKLPDYPARTRFAPSPTGFLHLGSLRTALFNFLLARATKGQFLLRIEDTDTKRTVPGALERICRDLEWAGLQWDEGPEVGGPYGPYRQSERTSLYREHADKLLEGGHAYRCFCTAERLHELAKLRSEIGLPPDYDRSCAGLSKAESDERAHRGERHTVRFKVPNTYPEYSDLVYGRVGSARAQNKKAQKIGVVSYEDPILLKSDGFPTYHLANVVDDQLMKITHVVRAAEWMPSTPKHLALYEAFGWTPPKFAHVGLLQDTTGQKLSKRNADIDIESYKKQGILPEALVNFCVLLGWSHNQTNDFMHLEELTKMFDLKFTKGNTHVTFKKLDYLQKQHLQQAIRDKTHVYDDILQQLSALLTKRQAEDSRWTSASGKQPIAYLAELLDSQQRHYANPTQFLDHVQRFFNLETLSANPRPDLDDTTVNALVQNLGEIPDGKTWNEESLGSALHRTTEAHIDKLGLEHTPEQTKETSTAINKFLRWALLGTAGPPMVTTMRILGQNATVSRLRSAVKAPH